jgi:murein L,D-transpeptidase YcbB/YkuD
MSYGRGRLAGCVSVAVLGGALYLTMSDKVQSQPAPTPPPPRPAAAVAPAAAPAGLRADQVQQMLRTLAEADQHGISPAQFGAAEIQRALASADPAQRQRGEAQLQRAVIAYAKAQRGGQIPTSAFLDDWALRPAAYNAEQDFNFALSQNRLAPWLASLAPPFERYRALQNALVQYRAIQARGGWAAVPSGPPLKPGMTDARVVALRARLAAEGVAVEPTSPLYDPALAAVVTAAQARYGQPADGVVGAGTVAALNRPVEARIAQITANMERWRWMPRAWPRTRIEVNIAGAMLDVFDDNVRVDSMKVAVGKSATRTPMLVSEIHSVVLNPPWNVPDSIASKELAPKGEAYLSRNGFRWVSNGAGGTRLQQKPGPGNSLGRIKFDFQNSFGVYLHDTNSKAAFERDARSVSHGCVRVERPMDLARILMERSQAGAASRIDAALQDSETVRAQLDQKWPVMIAYWTVFTDQSGQVNFRDDIYGWDGVLINLMQAGRISA